MAGASGKYVLTLEVNSAGAVQNVAEVKDQLQKTTAGMGALQKVQGPIFGVLNNLTGGLAGNLKDVFESVGGVTKGFGALKGAIIATGIGALVILVTELVTNFDKYKDTLMGVTAGQKQAAYYANLAYETENKKLEALNASDNVLKLQGKTEKEIYDIKLAQYDITVAQLKASIQQEQSLEAQRKSGQSLVDHYLRASGKAGGFVANLLYGKPGELDENEQKIADLQTQLLTLDNARAGLIIGEEKRVDQITTKIVEDLKKVTEARRADTANEIKELDVKLLALETASEKELATKKGYSALGQTQEIQDAQTSIQIEKDKAAAKAMVATTLVDFLGTLAQTLMSSQGKNAKREFAIGKALGISQATVNTFKGISAAIGSGPPPYNFILAGITAAAGFLQVRNIARQQFKESGGGGSSSASVGSTAGAMSLGGNAADPKSVSAPAIDFSFLNQKGASSVAPVQAYVLPGQISGPIEATQKIKDQSRL